jgi:H+/Cl- antiporter ClcA
MAAVLGVVFGAPLFGIAGNFEEKDWESGKSQPGTQLNKNSGRAFAPKEGRERLVSKPERLFVYALAVIGALLVMKGLTVLLGGSEGLPHFVSVRDGSIKDLAAQWIWIVPLILAGILAAVMYIVINKITKKIGTALGKYRVVSCVTAGALLGIAGHFLGPARFSGETQLGVLIADPTALTAGALLVFCVIKLLMVNVSVNFGWKGGTIFPMIFSASALGFAAAACIQNISGQNLEFAFGAAVVAASMLGFLMRKPVTVVAVLLLCFPLSYLPALAVSSFISAFFCKCIAKKSKKKKDLVNQ